MKLRITTLSENTGGKRGLLGEWGLSILLETDDAKILFDCGQTVSAAHNAEILDIDLSNVNKIVLSHGHYDHTGGLRDVLCKMKKDVEVIAHPDIWQAKYSRRECGSDSYIGIPFERKELEDLGARFVLTKESIEVAHNVITTGEVPMLTGFEQIDEVLFVKTESGWHPDKVLDDQALIVKDKDGLIVISGCAHHGIINTLHHARQLTGGDKIHTVIGGSHLIDITEERLWQTIDALRGLGIKRMGLCHCTDIPIIGLMAREFEDSFFLNNSGKVIEINS